MEGESVKPLCIDLYCGLGGWAEGFLSEGYRVKGFDVERHDYGFGSYPGELVLRDVCSIAGSEFCDADVIVASPPCQEFSVRAMPWGRIKVASGELPPPDLSLFEACFRIQREASELAGRWIPLVVENVRGAERWVGPARCHFGSYFLWGDPPALLPRLKPVPKIPGANFRNFRKTGEISPHWRLKKFVPSVQESGIKMLSPGSYNKPGSGADWFDGGAASFASNSIKRKAASAMLAKIPFPLAQHIARCFKPAESEIA